MMLTLALASTPEHVYERALNIFAAGDVAEAFAACRSITVPSQSRSLIRTDGRDGLYPRQQLRLVLKQKLGIELSP